MRAEGRLPAVIYMNGADSVHITVPTADLTRLYSTVGTSGVVDIRLEEGGTIPVIFRRVAREAVSHRPQHVEMMRVRMDVKVQVEVPVRLVGEPSTDTDAVLFTQRDRVRIEALPNDLPSHLEADASRLRVMNDSILAGDLALPDGVELIDSPDEVIASLTPPARMEPAPAELAEEAEAATEESPQGKPTA